MRENRLGRWWALAVALVLGSLGWIESGGGSITSAERIAPASGLLGLGLGLMAGLLIGSSRHGRLHIDHGRWDMTTVRDPRTRPGWALNGPISLTNSGDLDLTPSRIYLRWLRWGKWHIRVRVCLGNRVGEIPSGQVHPGGQPGRFPVHFYVRDKSSRGALGPITAHVTVRDTMRRRHRGKIVFPAVQPGRGATTDPS